MVAHTFHLDGGLQPCACVCARMQGDDFPRRFNSYGLVKPFTKTARQMRDAYRMAAEAALNAEPDATTDAAAPVDEVPAAPDTPASTTTTEGAAAADPAAATAAADAAPGTDAAAAAGSAAGADGAATTAAPAAAAAPLPPFRPSGPVPLSLSHNHVHLAFSSLRAAHGLHVETSSRVSSEIRSAVSDFLEEHLDAAVLLFHRDEADIKRKLCVDLSAACKPNQRKPKTKAKGAQADGKSAQATADADAAATTAKDEL